MDRPSNVKSSNSLTTSYFWLYIITFVFMTFKIRCHRRQYNSSRVSNDWRPVRVSEINIRSSACSKWFMFVSPMFTPATSPKYTRISSMYNLNNDGLITPPWRTPYVFSNSSPSSLFHFTRLLAFAKRLRSNWNRFPLKPGDRILNKRACRFTWSNADLKST